MRRGEPGDGAPLGLGRRFASTSTSTSTSTPTSTPTSFSTTLALVLTLTGVIACSAAPEVAPRPRPRPPLKVAQPPPVPAFYWEPLEVSIDPAIEATKLPLASEDVVVPPELSAAFAALEPRTAALLLERGFVILDRPNAPTTMGALYTSLAQRGQRSLITLDALSEVVHLAVSAALADVERTEIAAQLPALLARTAEKLETLTRGAPTDRARALHMARGIVWVALSLLGEGGVPADLDAEVKDEVRRVKERVEPRRSPLLGGATVDYQAARSDAASPEAERLADALVWLERAPLVLFGAEAGPGPGMSTQVARDATRAALLLAHVKDARVDAASAAAWARLENIERFLVGPTDDWSPTDLAALAAMRGLDVAQLAHIDDVTRIDRLRRAAQEAFRARLHDGGGTLEALAVKADAAPKEERYSTRSVAPTARFLGARLTLDGVVQQALVYPTVGAYRGSLSIRTAHGGRRILSRPLDLGAVLGSDVARAALKADGDDDFEGFDRALRSLVERRPAASEASRHASVYLSMLDLVSSVLGPSAADAALPAAAHREHMARVLELTVATHATARRDFTVRGRRLTHVLVEPAAEAWGPTLLVEPHPEAIARMVAVVRQLMRGLGAYGVMKSGSPTGRLVTSAERLLTLAFQAALLAANDLPPSEEDQRRLATFASWLWSLETATGAAAPRGLEVHVDHGSGRALAEGTGKIGELWMFVRDPASKKLTLVVGAATTHHEVVRSKADRLRELAWREAVNKGELPRATWTTGYRFATP